MEGILPAVRQDVAYRASGQEAVQAPQEKQRLKNPAPGREATSYLKSLSRSERTIVSKFIDRTRMTQMTRIFTDNYKDLV